MKLSMKVAVCVLCIGLSFGPAMAAGLGDAVKGVTDALNAAEGTKAPAQKAETAETKESGKVSDSSAAEGKNAGDTDKASLGIKEALNVGIAEAVKRVGAENGFYKNDAIKILLPENFQKADAFVRQIGGEELSESLVLKMNQAAEKAAPKALDIFVKAIEGMQIEDAAKLLSGEDNAATSYLEEHTSASLKEAFYPIVKSTMEEVGAVKLYNDYIGKFASNPLMKMAVPETDLSEYVTGKSLGGLFTIVAEEEKNIRQNPAARASDLLKDVFGSLGE
ncbi:MAG: DUF4197 domain-containing protein [Desulfococcaceae bacterium]